MKIFLKVPLIFVLALGFVVLAAWLSGKVRNDENPDSTTRMPSVSCPKTLAGFESLPGEQVIDLIPNEIPSYAANGQFVNPTIVVAKRGGVKSEVACGYIRIKAGTKTAGALRSWENIYINPYPYGGHLVVDGAILNVSGDTYTDLLLPLEHVSYRENRNAKEIQSANWAALLNVSDKVEFSISLNSEDRSGFIGPIQAGYRCINIETGEETHDCSLEVIERRGL